MGRRVVVVLQGSPPTPVSAVHFLDELTIHFLPGVPAQQQGLFGQDQAQLPLGKTGGSVLGDVGCCQYPYRKRE